MDYITVDDVSSRTNAWLHDVITRNFYPANAAEDIAEVRASLELANRVVHFALNDEDDLVGYVLLIPQGLELHVDLLTIDFEHQDETVARFLLKCAATDAVRIGYRGVLMRTDNLLSTTLSGAGYSPIGDFFWFGPVS